MPQIKVNVHRDRGGDIAAISAWAVPADTESGEWGNRTQLLNSSRRTSDGWFPEHLGVTVKNAVTGEELGTGQELLGSLKSKARQVYRNDVQTKNQDPEKKRRKEVA